MILNLTIILIIILVLCWYKSVFKNNTKEHFDMDDYLVQNYQNKIKFSDDKIVLVVETFQNLHDLTTLIRNILKQNIKVDSIIIISKQEDLKNIKLIGDVCLINKVGGLSFLFKESCNNTIIIYLFSEGFSAFEQPHFLNSYLTKNLNVTGIIKAENKLFNVCPSKIY